MRDNAGGSVFGQAVPSRFAGLADLERVLANAGPDATLDELEKLGLTHARAVALVRAFGDALQRKEIRTARAAQNALLKHPVGLPVKHPRNIPLMAWDRASDCKAQTASRYLFVSGVARSGTTALGLLLGIHRDVAMYIELFLPRYGYVPQMLEPRNVQMLSERGLLKLGKNNEAVLQKAMHCAVVGDKRPGFMDCAELTFPNFARSALNVVHTVRSIFDVAASYQRRFESGSWKKDFRNAVNAANRSNRIALSLLGGEHRDRLLIVDYDRFWRSEKNLLALFHRLDLDEAGIDQQRVMKLLEIARQSRAKQRQLADEQRHYIDEHYDTAAEAELKSATAPDLARDDEGSSL